MFQYFTNVLLPHQFHYRKFDLLQDANECRATNTMVSVARQDGKSVNPGRWNMGKNGCSLILNFGDWNQVEPQKDKDPWKYTYTHTYIHTYIYIYVFIYIYRFSGYK